MKDAIDIVKVVNAKLENAGSDNLNVNGSVTPVVFTAIPPVGKTWRVVKIAGYLEGQTGFSSEKFADLLELANGVEVKINGQVIATWKTNKDLAVGIQNLDAPLALAKQDRTLNGKWDLEESFGSAIIVTPDAGGIEVTVNDDLTTIDSFFMTVQGQVV